MMLAWIVWTLEPDKMGVVVYAKTRGEARWRGANEMSMEEDVLDLQVLRAPLADHLAESGKVPDNKLMVELCFWEGECSECGACGPELSHDGLCSDCFEEATGATMRDCPGLIDTDGLPF